MHAVTLTSDNFTARLKYPSVVTAFNALVEGTRLSTGSRSYRASSGFGLTGKDPVTFMSGYAAVQSLL